MDFINDNVIKCLKQEIDAYRDKYAIALQEIKELNYFSKEDNKKLKAEIDKEKEFAIETSIENDKLKAEIKSYIKAREGRINTIDDLKAEIKELKENSKKQYPKEYKAEAEEYFHHNPQAEKVLFYMLDNNERCIDYDTLEQYEIACIDNDNI